MSKSRKGLINRLAKACEPNPDRAMKDALFKMLGAGRTEGAYGGVILPGGKKAWIRFTIEEDLPTAAGEMISKDSALQALQQTFDRLSTTAKLKDYQAAIRALPSESDAPIEDQDAAGYLQQIGIDGGLS